MELTKRISGVLYAERNNFIYIDCMSGGSAQYKYPTDVVSDLEILNEESFIDQIGRLVQDNKISPTQLIIVLAPSLLFGKKFPLPTQDGGEMEKIQKFIDTVPFESVSYTKYTMTDGIQVIAANVNFFEAIKQAFEKQGFIARYVFPANILEEDMSEGINVDSAKHIVGNIEKIKQYNLLGQPQITQPIEKKEPAPIGKSKNSLYVLGGVFVVLFIILVAMIILQK